MVMRRPRNFRTDLTLAERSGLDLHNLRHLWTGVVMIFSVVPISEVKIQMLSEAAPMAQLRATVDDIRPLVTDISFAMLYNGQ